MDGMMLTRIVELAGTKDKRVGLRMVYKEFDIKDKEVRALIRDLWDSVHGDLKGETSN
jgi:hypothetical protein